MDLLLFSLILLLTASCEGEKKKAVVVTDCTGKPPFSNVKTTELYYRIVSTESSCMHIVWSMVSYPTLYAAYTNGTGLCRCNASTYSPINSNGSNLTIPGLGSDFSVGVVFKGLVEFSATKKNYAAGGLNLTVACNPDVCANVSCSYISLNDDRLTWTFYPENETFIGTYDLLGNNTHKNQILFSIRTHIPKVVGGDRLKYFPRTYFFENSTTFDLISENYPFVNSSSSRLALEVLLIHGENVQNGSVTVLKSLDDEYTPSVFSSYTYQTSGSQFNETRVGYMQWKPISYQDSSRKSTSSQQLHIVSADTPEAIDCKVEEIPAGLASSLYGTNFDHVSNVTHWFVVFGTDGDATYLSPSYNTWTAVVGTGEVPMDTLSTLVIVTISVGLGVPAVLVVLSAVYVFIKKKPWENMNRWMNSMSGRGYSKLS